MPGLSLVCVVGRGLGDVPGSAARILQAVAAAGVNVEMISLGASDIAIDFVVRQETAARAVRAIHDAFLAG
jgi:aspartate kinase